MMVVVVVGNQKWPRAVFNWFKRWESRDLSSADEREVMMVLWYNGTYYVAPYTDNTEWYVALMLAAGVWGGVGGA